MTSTPTEHKTALIKQSSILADALRYLSSGLGSVVADFGSYSLMTSLLGWHPGAANLISRPLGGVVSFILHKHWSFQNRGTAKTTTQFGRFWCVFLVSFALSEALVLLFHEVFHLGPTLTKLAAEGLCSIFNFICLRHWTFRK